MKKFKVLKQFSPVHGLTVETGAIVHLSESRRRLTPVGTLKEIIKKSRTKKDIENGSISDPD